MVYKARWNNKDFGHFIGCSKVGSASLKEFDETSTILVIIFWDILMFDKIFVSPQVKWMVIISNKHGIYELPYELPNDLRLKTLGN